MATCRLHARNVAAVAGAGPDEIAAVVDAMVESGEVNEGKAREILARVRQG